MSDLMSAIRDDMDEYESLCHKYGEEIQYSKDAYNYRMVDCYGKHAEELKEKNRKEQFISRVLSEGEAISGDSTL